MADCRKEAFSTPEAAERQMDRVRRGNVIGASANVYLCDHCGAWHWGRSDRHDKMVANMENAHRFVIWPPRLRRAALSQEGE